MDREPVRIKYWGMFWLTKTGYLLFNGIGWIIAINMCVAGVIMGVLPPFRNLWDPDPTWGIFRFFWLFLLICMAGQCIDAGVAWMKFAKKEEEQENERQRRQSREEEYDEPSEGIMEKPSGYRPRRPDSH
jgi:hypothetical protein